MAENYSQLETVARDYYNSDSANSFYELVWGGEDIHIGCYESEHEAIHPASRRTVAKMADLLSGLSSRHRVLDIGSGYGGSARYLAGKVGCHITCLNLSEVQNQRNRELNQQQGLADKIEVVDGSFEELPFDDNSFDVVWSQDAILHSSRRETVLDEVDRVLRCGGRFIFTDPMQTDSADVASLQPVYDRIHLSSLGSPGFYREKARARGWKEVLWEELSAQLVNHYRRVREEIIAREQEILPRCGAEYIERMKAGLQHWVDAGNAGNLTWGIFLFAKPEQV